MNIIEAFQLDLPINHTSPELLTLIAMQEKINESTTSNAKAYRKLFVMINELNRKVDDLKSQNESLRRQINQHTNKQTEWKYKTEDGYLFKMSV